MQIIDWEYAGMGTATDLGNLAVNNHFDDDQETALLEAYFGEPPDDRRRATLKLFRFMSDFREAMWGWSRRASQSSTSTSTSTRRSISTG